MTDTASSASTSLAQRKIRRVLVANRGEIALRIVRSIADTGRQSVAVYADQDIDAPFVRSANRAFALSGVSAAETYLDGGKIIEAALRAKADSLHPGYGFLAENADFASQVIDAGLTWIGPSPTAIDVLGDKVRARQTAIAADVAPVPGTVGTVTTSAEVTDFVNLHGYPIVLKAADGGGGRGIHVLRGESDLEQFFAGRDVTSGAGFFAERYVQKARHIETQCGRDSHGNFTVYSTRDCTVQRRHQKMIEEAPAPFLSEALHQQLHESSRRLFDIVDYVGLGTCEYLLTADGDLYFLEVNPRLQVEHTVTEEVTNTDLVAAQLAIASGETLPAHHSPRGHSIELRVTSEDPRADLFPTTGTLSRVIWPTGPGIRIDTGVGEGDSISPEFDSMIAKIIITAPNREQAIRRAIRVAEETVIEGVSTPLSLYAHILRQPEFTAEGSDELRVWTRWLEDGALDQFTQTLTADQQPAHSDTESTPGTAVVSEERSEFIIELDGRRAVLRLPNALLSAHIASQTLAQSTGFRAPQPLRTNRQQAKTLDHSETGGPTITCPMQAIVARVVAQVGDHVDEGDLVMVLESMKMEKYVHATCAGTLVAIAVTPGQNVTPGQVLATLDTEGDAA